MVLGSPVVVPSLLKEVSVPAELAVPTADADSQINDRVLLVTDDLLRLGS